MKESGLDFSQIETNGEQKEKTYYVKLKGGQANWYNEDQIERIKLI